MNSLGIVMRSVLREAEDESATRKWGRRAAIGAGVTAGGLGTIGAARGAYNAYSKIGKGKFGLGSLRGIGSAALSGAGEHLRSPLKSMSSLAKSGQSALAKHAPGVAKDLGRGAKYVKGLPGVKHAISAGQYVGGLPGRAYKAARGFIAPHLQSLGKKVGFANKGGVTGIGGKYGNLGLVRADGGIALGGGLSKAGIDALKTGAKYAGGAALAGGLGYGAYRMLRRRQEAKECAEAAAQEAYVQTYNAIMESGY